MTKKIMWLVVVGATACSFLLYANSIPGEFVYDDTFLVDQAHLHSWDFLKTIWREACVPGQFDVHCYRPITSLSFALNFLLLGNTPATFHVVNIVIHTGVIILFFLLVLALFSSEPFLLPEHHRLALALFAAIYFSFLPIHTEAVSYIKARDDLLQAFFVLCSWLVYIVASRTEDKHKYAWYGLSVFFFLLAILSKEFAVVAPFLFLGMEFLGRKVNARTLLIRGIPYLAVIVGYFLIRIVIFGLGSAFAPPLMDFTQNPLIVADFLTRISTVFSLLAIGIAKTFIPYHLSATYDYHHVSLVHNIFLSVESLVGVLFLAVLSWFIISPKFRATPFGAGAMLFIGSWSIASQFVFVGGEMFAEHYLYFPSLGLSMIAGFFLLKLYAYRRMLGISCCAMAIAIYGVIIVLRNPVWNNNIALYESMVRDAPNSIRGHTALAKWYVRKGEFERAIPYVENSMTIYNDIQETLAMLKILATSEIYENSFENLNRTLVGGVQTSARMKIHALSLARAQRYQESINFIAKNFGETPETLQSPILRFSMAVNYSRLGNLEMAEEFYDWGYVRSQEVRKNMINLF